jgi:hypothetical protein
MSDERDELAALKKKVEELEAKVSPPKSDFVPKSVAEHMNEVHQMREGRMSLASNFHPDDLRAMEAAAPTSVVKDIALRDARAPTGPNAQGAIPSSQQVSNVRTGGGGSGWAHEVPLSNPPGTNWVDALCIADDVKQRSKG